MSVIVNGKKTAQKPKKEDTKKTAAKSAAKAPAKKEAAKTTAKKETAKEALRLATHKLPCKCKIVSKADLEGGAANEN